MAFLADDGKSVDSILTALDVLAASNTNGLTLVPNSLAECMQERPAPFHGEPEPLAIAETEALGEVLQSSGDADGGTFTHDAQGNCRNCRKGPECAVSCAHLQQWASANPASTAQLRPLT